jgi:hypothetical protein
VRATVTDLSRLEAAGEGRIRALPAALEVRVGTARMFYLEGERLTALARVTSAGGKPGAGAAVQITALFGTVRGGETEFEPFHSGRVSAGADGLASLEVPLERSGRIRLLARVDDGGGRIAEDRADLWVAGEGAKLRGEPTGEPQPERDEEGSRRDGEIDVLADRLVYREGETIRLLVRSPLSPLTALLTVEGERLHEARPITIKKICEVLESPARAEFAPQVSVLLNAWSRGQALAGGVEVFVHPRSRSLEVEAAADRSSYQPGETMAVTVSTRSQGQPVPAEVELGTVDESIFSLAADRSPDIRAFFARSASNSSSTAGTSDAGIGRRTSEAEEHVSLLSAASEDSGSAPALLRHTFPDTLYWSGQLQTGPDGKAVVRIEAPDGLTTWRLTARAVSGEDRFGAGVSSTLTRKEVIVRLSAPRFFTERDVGTVSTIVYNGLAQENEFTVRLSAGGTPAGPERALKVPARAAERLDWKLPPARPGKLVLRAEALSAAGSDRVEIELPVRPHGAEERQLAAGRVDGSWHGSLSLPGEASIGTAVLTVAVTTAGTGTIIEALPFLAGYPYGCVEQTMSRFLPAVVAAEALRRLGIASPELEKSLPDMAAQGLQRLYRFQHHDGGWGWWTDDATDPAMTAYVVFGLATARRAGFAVDPETLARALDRLGAMTSTPFSLYARSVAGADGPRGPPRALSR